jgi:hypothetical protein
MNVMIAIAMIAATPADALDAIFRFDALSPADC